MTTTILDATLDELSEMIDKYADLKEQKQEMEIELEILKTSIFKAFELAGMTDHTTDKGTDAWVTTGSTTRILVKEAKYLLSADMFKTLCHTTKFPVLHIQSKENTKTGSE